MAQKATNANNIKYILFWFTLLFSTHSFSQISWTDKTDSTLFEFRIRFAKSLSRNISQGTFYKNTPSDIFIYWCRINSVDSITFLPVQNSFSILDSLVRKSIYESVSYFKNNNDIHCLTSKRFFCIPIFISNSSSTEMNKVDIRKFVTPFENSLDFDRNNIGPFPVIMSPLYFDLPKVDKPW